MNAHALDASPDEQHFRSWCLRHRLFVNPLNDLGPSGDSWLGLLGSSLCANTMQEPPYEGPLPTLWSHAVDVIAFGAGQGRLIVVSAGNARESQWLTLAEQYPQLQLSEKIHEPAQAANALTVGAYTERVELPPGPTYSEYRVVAKKPGGISPFASDSKEAKSGRWRSGRGTSLLGRLLANE